MARIGILRRASSALVLFSESRWTRPRCSIRSAGCRGAPSRADRRFPGRRATMAWSSNAMSHALAAVQVRERALIVALLLAVFAVNFMDRQIVAIVSEPIRHEFGLSDAQSGLLYGLAFAVVYSIAGIPIARWADRANRAHIINGSLIVFSVMTMAC